MNAAKIKETRTISEKARHMRAAVRLAALVNEGHAVANRFAMCEVAAELRDGIRGQFFVGVQEQNPFSGGVLERGISSCGEIVAPLEDVNLCAEFLCNLDRAVGGAGVYNDDFVGDCFDRTERLPEEFFFVFNDVTDA